MHSFHIFRNIPEQMSYLIIMIFFSIENFKNKLSKMSQLQACFRVHACDGRLEWSGKIWWRTSLCSNRCGKTLINNYSSCGRKINLDETEQRKVCYSIFIKIKIEKLWIKWINVDFKWWILVVSIQFREARGRTLEDPRHTWRRDRKKNPTTNLKIATSIANLAFCHQVNSSVKPSENNVITSTFRVL